MYLCSVIPNVRYLFFALSLGFLLLMGNLFYHQVILGDWFSRRPFYDRRWIALMEALIDQRAITLEGDEVKLDEARLGRLSLSASQRERVKALLPYVEMDDLRGRLRFNRDGVKIINARVFGGHRAFLRGRILDWRGRVLAEDRVSPRTRRQVRYYTVGPELFPLIGHSHPAYGRRRLEEALNDYLLGVEPKSPFWRIRDFIEPYKVGNDVVLTLEAGLQRVAYLALAPHRGAAVVLEVGTGRVLALASRPSFDPNLPSGPEWLKAAQDRANAPFSNRALEALYPPGSTFKVIDVAAALDSGRVPAGYRLSCTGRHPRYRIRDEVADGPVDMEGALALSCNVYFAEVGVRLGPLLQEYAGRFGFGQPFDLVPPEAGGGCPVEPSLAFSWNHYLRASNSQGGKEITGKRVEHFRPADFRRNPGVVAQCAIGQNLISVTPLQMALVAATIAHRGRLVRPYVVEEIRRGGSGESLRRFHPQALGQAISPRAARRLTGMMEAMMEWGTGEDLDRLYAADGREISVAGKTGTAEVGDRNGNRKIDPDERPHSWFIAFAPADDPRVAIAVVVENGGAGSQEAGPIAMKVLASALGAHTGEGSGEE